MKYLFAVGIISVSLSVGVLAGPAYGWLIFGSVCLLTSFAHVALGE